MGSINFGSNGGTLTTGGLKALPTQLTGTGTINSKGLVSGFDLMFDGTASYSTTFGTAGTLAVNMIAATGNGDLGVGYGRDSTLTVRNRAVIYSNNGDLGGDSGFSGTATVDGVGLKWTNSSDFYIGDSGNGTLNIRNGGSVSSSSLYVGNSGSGTLNITNGGAVLVTSMTSVSESMGSINFGSNGGTLTTGCLKTPLNRLTGTGTINSNGLISDFDLMFDRTATFSTMFGAAGTLTVDMMLPRGTATSA